jgi:glycosyltransferase involved in cell wall biosynthesis
MLANIFKIFKENNYATIGVSIYLIFVIVAIFADFIAPNDPLRIHFSSSGLARNLPPDIQLDVLGSDIRGNRFSKAFETLANENKNITFHSWTNDRKVILSKLDAADVLLYGSKREGCPFTVMEALESSTLPIVTKTPGCLELSEALGTPSLKISEISSFDSIRDAYEEFFNSDTEKLISRDSLLLSSSDNVEKEFFEVFKHFLP